MINLWVFQTWEEFGRICGDRRKESAEAALDELLDTVRHKFFLDSGRFYNSNLKLRLHCALFRFPIFRVYVFPARISDFLFPLFQFFDLALFRFFDLALFQSRIT